MTRGLEIDSLPKQNLPIFSILLCSSFPPINSYDGDTVMVILTRFCAAHSSVSIDINKAKLCEVSAVLEGESDTYRRAVIESIANAEARIILSDVNACSPPSPPPMPNPQETQTTNTLLIVLIIGIVVALVLVCAFGTICVYMVYRRSQMQQHQPQHVNHSQALYPPYEKVKGPLLLELPGSPQPGPSHAFGKEPVAEASELRVVRGHAYEQTPLTHLSPPITPSQDDDE